MSADIIFDSGDAEDRLKALFGKGVIVRVCLETSETSSCKVIVEALVPRWTDPNEGWVVRSTYSSLSNLYSENVGGFVEKVKEEVSRLDVIESLREED